VNEPRIPLLPVFVKLPEPPALEAMVKITKPTLSEYTHSVFDTQFLPRVPEHCEFIEAEVGAKAAPFVLPVAGVLTYETLKA
jgi:hypothetical protein